MRIQSMVTATLLTAVCLLGAPLRGPSADESQGRHTPRHWRTPALRHRTLSASKLGSIPLR